MAVMSNPYSTKEWLQLNLQQQGLLHPASSVAKTIEQLSYVQIDSINVVERAHHHVLQTRLPGYQAQFLDDALASGQVFEYWSHAAAYLPMADYRFSLFRKQHLRQGGTHWFEPDHKVMQQVRDRIRYEGPLKASDFSHDDVRNGTWWDWKPAKKALEQLFMRGELMVLRRDKFQKVYDLTDRVLPAKVNTEPPTDVEFARHLINRYLQAHAFGNAAQIAYLRKGLKPLITSTLATMRADGELADFIEAGQRYYYSPELNLTHTLGNNVWLLNPFDNLMIQRQRLKQWFNFDYQIEVYVPAEKRQFGYYSLGILHNHTFVGRVDVKAQRDQGRLMLQHLVIDEGKLTGESELADFIPAFCHALSNYARFNGCQRWKLVKCNHKALKQLFSRQQAV